MILLSGGFDPIHHGHVRMIQAAREHGPVCIALNSDDWLIRKKGYCVLPWEARKEVLEAMRCRVERVDDTDGTVCEAIERLKPEFFGNGGDRIRSNTPEVRFCEEVGIETVFSLGGGKIASSSDLMRSKVERSWGHYEVLLAENGYKVKRLVIGPGKDTSVQKHFKRDEIWIRPEALTVQVIPAEKWHQIRNDGATPIEIIEIQVGDCQEEDIERK